MANLLPERTDSETADGEQLEDEVAELPVSMNSLDPDVQHTVFEWMEADSNEPGHE